MRRDPVNFLDGSGTPVVGTLREGGRRGAVVLTHGIDGSRRMPELEALGEALEGTRDVLSIDVRGHGDGPGRFTWGRDEWMQVAAAARFLGAPERPVAAVGFSFGGYHTAKAACAGAPFDRIALVGAPFDFRLYDRMPLSRALWRHLPLMIRRRRRLPRVERLPRMRERALHASDLSRIAVPTLVVHGSDDWLVSRRHAEAFAAAIPGATFLEIEGGLHAEYLMQSSPSILVDALRGFLTRP
jgi:pimeloyl-ACP methyl ester carboxylesterase